MGDATVRGLLTTTMLFVLTAGAEILGCYTVYLWLKAAGSTERPVLGCFLFSQRLNLPCVGLLT